MDSSLEKELSSERELKSSITYYKELQKEYEKEEKYAEAEKIQIKIEKIKEKHLKKEIVRLRSQQRSERQSIGSIFKSEIKEFDQKWDLLIKNCGERYRSHEEELKKEQKKKIDEEREKLEQSAPSFFKPSVHLLNLIKCKEKAVLTKKYKEAQNLLKEIEETTEFEKENYLEQREFKINKQLQKLQKRLNKELEVLRLKHEKDIREIQKARDMEKASMEKKVENINRELESAQKIQVNIAKGLHTNAGLRVPQRPSSSHSTPQKSLTNKKSFHS